MSSPCALKTHHMVRVYPEVNLWWFSNTQESFSSVTLTTSVQCVISPSCTGSHAAHVYLAIHFHDTLWRWPGTNSEGQITVLRGETRVAAWPGATLTQQARDANVTYRSISCRRRWRGSFMPVAWWCITSCALCPAKTYRQHSEGRGSME